MSTSVFDLSGIFNLQRQYLVDVSNSGIGTGTSKVNEVNTTLGNIITSLGNSLGSANQAVTQQDRVIEILDREKKRLDQRSKLIDQASETQDHINQLNDSARKRFSAYNSILIVLIITFGLYYLLSSLYSYGISSMLLDSLIVIVFAVGIIISLYYYADISTRDNMDFDRIQLPDPQPKTLEQQRQDAQKAYASGNLMGGTGNQCVGSQCCPSGSIFSVTLNKCVVDIPCTGANKVKFWTGADLSCVTLPPTGTYNANAFSITCPSGNTYTHATGTCNPETFTTLDQSNGVKAMEPFEYEDYAPYRRIK